MLSEVSDHFGPLFIINQVRKMVTIVMFGKIKYINSVKLCFSAVSVKKVMEFNWRLHLN